VNGEDSAEPIATVRALLFGIQRRDDLAYGRSQHRVRRQPTADDAADRLRLELVELTGIEPVTS
jgi:hypothetical protein